MPDRKYWQGPKDFGSHDLWKRSWQWQILCRRIHWDLEAVMRVELGLVHCRVSKAEKVQPQVVTTLAYGRPDRLLSLSTGMLSMLIID